MKELKKLSLKEEVDKEAQRIEEEVRSRNDLDDITVSEDMETSLFNKIQDYEYDKRFKKTVRRKKKKYRIYFALAAVLILVCGSVMTGTGSKSYWKVLMDRIAGEEQATVINVENMDSQETKDLDEVQVFNEIRRELGISPVHFGYMPENMYLERYELEVEQKRAVLLYDYNDQTIQYTMYMNDTDSSHAQIEIDQLVDEYSMTVFDDIVVDVKEYSVTNFDNHRYVAEFEYVDAQYQLAGVMEKEEFEKIIKNLYFI